MWRKIPLFQGNWDYINGFLERVIDFLLTVAAAICSSAAVRLWYNRKQIWISCILQPPVMGALKCHWLMCHLLSVTSVSRASKSWHAKNKFHVLLLDWLHILNTESANICVHQFHIAFVTFWCQHTIKHMVSIP